MQLVTCILELDSWLPTSMCRISSVQHLFVLYTFLSSLWIFLDPLMLFTKRKTIPRPISLLNFVPFCFRFSTYCSYSICLAFCERRVCCWSVLCSMHACHADIEAVQEVSAQIPPHLHQRRGWEAVQMLSRMLNFTP